jgi:hypothetical protein
MEKIMATAQTDGSATTSSSTNNNNGAAMNVGGSSTVLSNQALGAYYNGVFGSTPVDNDSADKALSAGVFKFENTRGVTQRVTSTLAGGVSNSFLTHSADDYSNRRSIHRQEVVRTTRTTTAVRAGYWNIYGGNWTTTPTTAVDLFWDISGGSTSETSTDQAASPTSSVPGELVYKLGQPLPVMADYAAKTA